MNYRGFFQEGLFDNVGREITSEEDYFGGYSKGQRQGCGFVQNKKDGSDYLGYWVDDVKDVFGRQKMTDGNIYEGAI